MSYTVHPDRYSKSKVVLRKSGVIIHTSESGDGSLAALLSRMTLPGDRQWFKDDGSLGGMYGSSYHALADGSTSSYVQVLGADCGPYSAPPLNKNFWHICMPGRSAQTRPDWLEPMSRGQIRAVARFIVDKAKVDGFPLVKLAPEDLPAGRQGYAAHRDVTYGFQIKGGHTDPGTSFPWDVLAADIKELTTDPVPEEEEDMARIVRICEKDSSGQWQWIAPEQFVVTGASMEWLSSIERRDAVIAAGHATLNPGTGAPFRLGRDSLKYYRLVGELPAGSVLKKSEFFQG